MKYYFTKKDMLTDLLCEATKVLKFLIIITIGALVMWRVFIVISDRAEHRCLVTASDKRLCE